MPGAAAERTPIIVGAAQLTHQWDDGESRLDPLALMEEAVSLAVADTRAPALRQRVDALWVLNTITWSYRDAPGALAQRLGIDASDRLYTAVGGNTPQVLVNRACEGLQSGRLRAVVIVGGEAGCSAQRAAKTARELGWPPIERPERIDGDDRMGANQAEFAYELVLPVQMYPFIETALRARSGRSPEEHREFLGRLCARFAAVAARNPYAWFRTPPTAAEIATPAPDNRYVGYPYTKLMNAIMAVDQSAALILTTESEAAAAGIPRERWVYPMGGAALNDVWHVTERPHLDESPAIRLAAREALTQAGIAIDDVGVFDIYSCFPSAVQLACDALGISIDDERPLTVTGGLPYFGGPGNNYSTHAIATAVGIIREQPRTKALITALGWYATKHAVGIYGSHPARRPWTLDLSGAQAAIDASAVPAPLTAYDGDMTIEAFVVRHGRDGAPRAGVVLGATPHGRALAAIDADTAGLAEIERSEQVGGRWTCRHDAGSGKNLARPA